MVQQSNLSCQFLILSVRPLAHRQPVKIEGRRKWDHCGYWQNFSVATSSSQFFLRWSPLRYYFLQDSLHLKQSTELWEASLCFLPTNNPPVFVLLWIDQPVHLPSSLPQPCYPSTPLSNSFYLAPSHLACSVSISKQTHFLLTRRSVAVICCACQVEYWATLWPLSTKGGPRKLEGRRYLCIEWIISPTRHSAFSLCAACNRHAACRCQDGSLVASAKRTAWEAVSQIVGKTWALLCVLQADWWFLEKRVDDRRRYLWGILSAILSDGNNKRYLPSVHVCCRAPPPHTLPL